MRLSTVRRVHTLISVVSVRTTTSYPSTRKRMSPIVNLLNVMSPTVRLASQLTIAMRAKVVST